MANQYPTHGHFTKKSITIQAYHLPEPGEGLPDDFHDWCTQVGFSNFSSDRDEGLFIHTLEGEMRADPGDWVIKGVKGEFYPCKPDIFEATYEVADRAMRAGETDAVAHGEVISAICNYATVKWAKQTSTKGGGDPKNSYSWPITGTKVYLAPQLSAGADSDDSLLLCASDLQHSSIYDNHGEMQSCMRAVAERITALATQPAKQEDPLPEPEMIQMFEGGPTWPHYRNLQVGQRVRVHTGEEGIIKSIGLSIKKYQVQIRPDYSGQYGSWEVTPLAGQSSSKQ